MFIRKLLARYGFQGLPQHTQRPVDTLPKKQRENVVIGPSLVESMRAEIGHIGDMVYLDVGGQRLEIDYPTAIKFSSLLRVHAKQAKKFAGDGRKHWTSESVLTDAELNYKRGF